MPTSAPVPTAARTGALVKISASGPMPTSRYCDHTPCAISTSLTFAASGEPGTMPARLSPSTLADGRARGLGARGIAARLLFDHALEQALDEGHAAGLDDLQVAGREQPGLGLSRTVASLLAMHGIERGDARGLTALAAHRRTASDGEFLALRAGRSSWARAGTGRAAPLHGRRRAPAHIGLPEAADQGGAVGVAGEAGRGQEVQGHGAVCLR
jgi:hypothetical protein